MNVFAEMIDAGCLEEEDEKMANRHTHRHTHTHIQQEQSNSKRWPGGDGVTQWCRKRKRKRKFEAPAIYQILQWVNCGTILPRR